MSRDASFPSLVVPPRRYTADDAGGRADKFGWLGSATPNISVADSKLEFSLNFSRAGVLAVEYLKSYDWNGTVALSVDGAQLHENALSAHWEDRSTQRATTTFAFGTRMNINSQSLKRLPNQYHISEASPPASTTSHSSSASRHKPRPLGSSSTRLSHARNPRAAER